MRRMHSLRALLRITQAGILGKPFRNSGPGRAVRSHQARGTVMIFPPLSENGSAAATNCHICTSVFAHPALAKVEETGLPTDAG
jgi:hypothetical protein